MAELPAIEPHHQFLLEHELSERWRVTRRTLQRWRRRGVGPPFVKVQGRVLYAWEDVLALEARDRQSLAVGRTQ